MERSRRCIAKSEGTLQHNAQCATIFRKGDLCVGQYIEKFPKETHQTIDSRFWWGMGRVQVKGRNFHHLLSVEMCWWTVLQREVEKSKLWRKGKDRELPGVQQDGMNSGWPAFWDNGSTEYEAFMVDVGRSASVQTHRMNSTKSEP